MLLVDHQDLAGRHGPGRGGPPFFVEQGKLTEDFTGREDCQDDLLVVDHSGYFHAAFAEKIGHVSLLPFAKDDRPGGEMLDLRWPHVNLWKKRKALSVLTMIARGAGRGKW